MDCKKRLRKDMGRTEGGNCLCSGKGERLGISSHQDWQGIDTLLGRSLMNISMIIASIILYDSASSQRIANVTWNDLQSHTRITNASFNRIVQQGCHQCSTRKIFIDQHHLGADVASQTSAVVIFS